MTYTVHDIERGEYLGDAINSFQAGKLAARYDTRIAEEHGPDALAYLELRKGGKVVDLRNHTPEVLWFSRGREQ